MQSLHLATIRCAMKLGAYRVLSVDFSALGAVTMYSPQGHDNVSR